MTDGQKEEVVVMLEPETREMIDARLEYGDSRSAWIRRAVRDALQAEATASTDDD